MKRALRRLRTRPRPWVRSCVRSPSGTSASSTPSPPDSLGNLAVSAPVLASRGAGQFVYVDVDDTIIEVHGYKKQGAGYGYSGVRGLNALLATATHRRLRPR